MERRTLTVRALPPETYEGLKEIAAHHGRSMEAEARQILQSSTNRLLRWTRDAVLADLSGRADLADLATPYVRSADTPRPADLR